MQTSSLPSKQQQSVHLVCHQTSAPAAPAASASSALDMFFPSRQVGGRGEAVMGTLERVGLAVALIALIVAERAAAGSTVTEILVSNGLPQGLLPGTVQDYSLSDDGKFQVTLASACTTKISTEEVKYQKSITGKLSYGKITNLSGIQAHEFFWISISSIEVDSKNPGIIWFEVGFLAKSLSVDLFQVPPTCNSLAAGEDAEGSMAFSEWLSKALGGALEVTGAARKLVQ